MERNAAEMDGLQVRSLDAYITAWMSPRVLSSSASTSGILGEYFWKELFGAVSRQGQKCLLSFPTASNPDTGTAALAGACLQHAANAQANSS